MLLIGGEVRGVCVAIVCVFIMCLINYITLCGRGGVSEEEFPFNCYDCNGLKSILNMN